MCRGFIGGRLWVTGKGGVKRGAEEPSARQWLATRFAIYHKRKKLTGRACKARIRERSRWLLRRTIPGPAIHQGISPDHKGRVEE
jgi:hypothetical protein